MQNNDYYKYCQWKKVPDVGMIELTNCCNFACVMCSNRQMKRKKGFMKFETFRKALDVCQEAQIRSIKLYTTGEALLHPDFMEFWRLAITYPFATIMISTNGSLLNQKIATELVQCRKLRIQFSFSGWSKASYESKYVNGNFDESLEKIKLLTRLIAAAGLPKNTLIINGVVSARGGTIQKCKQFLQDNLFLDEKQLNIHTGGNWNYIVDPSEPATQNEPNGAPIAQDAKKYYCHIANTRIGILFDGTITACGCLDVNGELVIGDISNVGITQAREGPLFQDFIQKLDSGNVGSLICSRCDTLKVLVPG